MATLNLNLGSLPLQAGNRVDLIPGYRDAIAAMTAEVETATDDASRSSSTSPPGTT